MVSGHVGARGCASVVTLVATGTVVARRVLVAEVVVEVVVGVVFKVVVGMVVGVVVGEREFAVVSGYEELLLPQLSIHLVLQVRDLREINKLWKIFELVGR